MSSHQSIYSPNNNTSQNIDIYNKLNKQNINYNNQTINNQNESFCLMSYENNNNIYGNPNYQITEYLQSPNNIQIKDNNLYNNFNNNLNNENIDNKNNSQMNNDKIDNKNKDKNEKDNKDIVEDPDEILFKNNDKKKEDVKNEEEELLSSDSDKNSFDEKEYKNVLYGQYVKDKIKRIKNRWKVHLHGCIVNRDDEETVIGKINGDLERDW